MEPIYLESDEEITSIIDKIKANSSGKLAVVIPKNSTILQSLVNLKLLAREAKSSGKEITLISTNKIAAKLASQVGLSVYPSLGTLGQPSANSDIPSPEVVTLPDGTKVNRYNPDKSEAVIQQTPPSPPDAAPTEPTQSSAVSAEQSSEEKPEPPESPSNSETGSSENVPVSSLPPIIARGRTQKTRFEFKLPLRSLLAALAILLFGLVILFLFLPKATVTLTFPAKEIDKTVVLQARTIPDGKETTITGSLLASSQQSTQQFAATGKKDVGTKSSGTISARNCEDSNPHSLSAGSKVVGSGKTFLTNNAVTIPAGTFSGGGSVCTSSSVNIAITAEQAGEGYNLSNATFTFAGLSSRISGVGSTSGGTTKVVTVLSQEDVDAAVEKLKVQLTDLATADLTEKAAGQAIIEGGLNVAVKKQETDKAVGAETESANLTIEVEVTTIAYVPEELQRKVEQALSAELEETEQLIIPEDSQPSISFKEFSEDKTVMTLEVAAKGFAAPMIDKKEVARKINNLTSESAEEILKSEYGASEVSVQINPNWWLKRLPMLSGAISIEYGFVRQSNGESTDEISGT